jgi:serine protease
VSYDWDFDDGTTGIGVTTTHVYSTAGTYTVTLTVTDGDGATGTDTASVIVTAPNQPPVADAGLDQTAFVGETVTFDGSGSYDPDGTIESYAWDFNDGATGTGVTTTHAYSTAEIYTVTLTVTDDKGATGTDTMLITVTEAPANTMHVVSIVMSTTKYKAKGWFTYATATVKIVDANGEPVNDAKVSGIWTGLTDDSDSGTTDGDGEVALDSDSVKNAHGTFTFTVTGVEHHELTYDPDANSSFIILFFERTKPWLKKSEMHGDLPIKL